MGSSAAVMSNTATPTLAIVRSVGHHKLAIAVNEKYIPFQRINYIGGNVDPDEWTWLNLKKVALINLDISPLFFVDPIYLRDAAYGMNSWAYLKGLEKAVETADFVDTAEVSTFFSRQCASVCRRLRKPLITTVIETIPRHITTRVPPYSWNTRFVVENTDLFVVPTERSKEFLLSISADEGKIKVIPFGVDTEIFHSAKGSKSWQNTRILFVSPLTSKRGLPELLRSFAVLCGWRKDVELWVCGRGPLETLVKEYVQKNPVKFLGFVPWKEMPEIYRQCDVFCIHGKDVYKFGVKLSEDGQYTTVVLEAMASGLPVVVSDSGAYPEMVGPENFVVAQGSKDGLCKALTILAEDEKKRREIGGSNRRRAEEHFCGKRQCERYAQELMKLVG